MFSGEDYFNIARWKKLYYDYNLSESSFSEDIEEPLKLSEDEETPVEWQNKIKESPSQQLVRP